MIKILFLTKGIHSSSARYRALFYQDFFIKDKYLTAHYGLSKKISNSNKGIKRTNEFKKQRSERYLGKNNPNSKVIILYNNKDEIIDIIEGGIRSYLKDNKLPPSLEKTYRHNTTIKNGDYVGWYCRIKEKNGL